jgi:hypothetical protein
MRGFNPITAVVSLIVSEPSSTRDPLGSVTERVVPWSVREDVPVTEIALGALERTAPEVGDVAVKVFATAGLALMKRLEMSSAARLAGMDIFFTFPPYSPD